MPEFLGLLLPLLLPPAALLFLNLSLSRRLRYPHFLITEERRRGAASFLFSVFKTYYDAFLDALLVLFIALALWEARPIPESPARLAGLSPEAGALEAGARIPASRRAVVIDCSRSMAMGLPGRRPIDLAMEKLAKDPALKSARRFALAFDPGTGGSRLYRLTDIIGDREGQAAAISLTSELPFFSVDYAELGKLSRRRFRDIVLITDSAPARSVSGFRVIELGTALPGGELPEEARGVYGVYPAAALYESLSGSYLAAFTEVGTPSILRVSQWDEGSSRFKSLNPGRYRVEETQAGRRVRLPGPGLYLFSFEGPYGQIGADFPLRMSPGLLPAKAEGPLSELVLSALPYLEASPRPSWEFRDGKEGAARPRIISSAFSKEEGRSLLDPRMSRGRLIGSRAEAGLDFALGAESLSNPDLVLAYDGAVTAGLSPAFSADPSREAGRLLSAGSSYIVSESRLPLIPGPEEFFSLSPPERFEIPPPPPRRVLWALLLSGVLLLKLLVWKRLSGKRILDLERSPAAGGGPD